MKKSHLVAALCGAAFNFISLSANAALVTYDFTGNAAGNPLGLGIGDLGASIAVSSGGLSVDITGKDFDTGDGPSANLNRTAPGGLGVSDAAGIARVGSDEAIEFDFSPATVLGISSVVFETGTSNGSLDLYVDNVFAENIAWTTGGFNLVLHVFATAPTGSVFEFRGNANSFRLGELKVETVPVPPAILLLGTGLVGLLGFGRRKRQAS